jgi:tetratricopeptide (TPR) repeat protein
MERAHLRNSWKLLIVLLVLSTTKLIAADETNAPPVAAKTVSEDAEEARRAMQAYLQLQEQLHATQLAVQQAREDAEATARRNNETTTERLKLIEQSLALQRQQEVHSLQSAQRLILSVAGAFATVAMLALLGAGWLQLRAMNRLAEVAASLSTGAALRHAREPAALLPGETMAVAGHEPEISNARLLGVIDRLEKRIHELENATRRPTVLTKAPEVNGNKQGVVAVAFPGAAGREPQPAAGEGSDPVALLLGKGQALLNLDQPEKALVCFEEILKLEPDHAEALVKKGTALERLKKLEEAIECYDRAIAANRSLTVAYLCKGGACNQLERFDEALACYEQALRTQEKSGASASPAGAQA